MILNKFFASIMSKFSLSYMSEAKRYKSAQCRLFWSDTKARMRFYLVAWDRVKLLVLTVGLVLNRLFALINLCLGSGFRDS